MADDPPSSDPQLSVVISTLGRYELLERVLDGFARQDVDPRRFEVLVVADAADPDPDAVKRATGRRPYAARVLTGTVPGASANRNTGWRAARSSLVLFTDNDTVPVPGFLGEHLRWHGSAPAPEVVVIGPVRWARELDVTPFMKWLDRGIQFDFGTIEGTEASWAHVYSANVSIKRSFLSASAGSTSSGSPTVTRSRLGLPGSAAWTEGPVQPQSHRRPLAGHGPGVLEGPRRADRRHRTALLPEAPRVRPDAARSVQSGGRAAAAAGKGSPRGQVRADGPALAGPVRLEPGRHLLVPANRSSVSRRLGCRGG